MKKGDIILTPFPFTDLTGLKNRPALVLAETDLDVTVAFITSQLKWQEEFDIKLEPEPDNGLKKTSLVRLTKLGTLDKEIVIGRLGSIKASEIGELNTNLIGLFKLK